MIVNVYLFDLDDTLISSKIYADIYQPVLDFIKKKFGFSNKELDGKAISLGLKKNKFGRWDTGDLCKGLGLLDEYYKILEKEIKVQSVLNEDVSQVLKSLKSDKKIIGVVSNSMLRTVNAFLNRYKIIKFVDFVFSFDDASCKKRDEKYWKKLIKKHKLKPKDCIVVGDDIDQDIIIPGNLGFQTFLIKTPTDLRLLISD